MSLSLLQLRQNKLIVVRWLLLSNSSYLILLVKTLSVETSIVRNVGRGQFHNLGGRSLLSTFLPTQTLLIIPLHDQCSPSTVGYRERKYVGTQMDRASLNWTVQFLGNMPRLTHQMTCFRGCVFCSAHIFVSCRFPFCDGISFKDILHRQSSNDYWRKSPLTLHHTTFCAKEKIHPTCDWFKVSETRFHIFPLILLTNKRHFQ